MDALRAAEFFLGEILHNRDIGRTVNVIVQAITNIRTANYQFQQSQLYLKSEYGENSGQAIAATAMMFNYYQTMVSIAQAFAPKNTPEPPVPMRSGTPVSGNLEYR